MVMLNADCNKTKSDRVGRYVQQPAGYRAFIFAPLPPDPPNRLQDLMVEEKEVEEVLEGDNGRNI